jgi:repressor LexA
MYSELTSKQKKFLVYLQKNILQQGKAPSLRQAAEEMGISHAAIAQMIKTLEEKGFIKRHGRYSRTIYILNRVRKASAIQRWLEIPIIGRITAGLPMYAQEEWDGSLVVDSGIYRGQNLFALKIKGESMKNAGILHGDLAICEPRQFALNGEIVVALINNEEATVKRFFLHEQYIELCPENENFQPIQFGFSEVLIQGKVVGIHRGPEEMEKI